MLFKSEIDFANLIDISSGGMKVATYPEIVNMLRTRYREIYGSDIDLNPANADGTFIQDIALLINNILQANQMLYANLDVDSASGVYLDNLCKLSNVYRKSATSSQARVKVENLGNAQITLNGLHCLDVNGLIWNNTDNITLEPNAYTYKIVSCEQVGSIKAPAGTITQAVYLDSNMIVKITQSTDALVGSDEETDAELKARRNDSNSPIGVTTIDSMVGALLNVAGVRDCMIVNNNTNNEWADGTGDTIAYKGYDGTTINPHSIYVVIRTDGVVNDTDIGNTIYNKLTAGIQTTESASTGTHGTPKSIQHYPNLYAPTQDGFATTIYWKQAVPIAPLLTIVLTEQPYFNASNMDVVGKGMVEYLNGLQINTELDENDITLKMLDLDPEFKGRATYVVSSVTIGSGDNTLTYYDYDGWEYNTSTHTFYLYNHNDMSNT